jgi:hypothetical protein
LLNSQLTNVSAKLLVNKLGVLARRLQEKSSPSGLNTSLTTFEEVLSEAIKTLTTFYGSLTSPGFTGWYPLMDTEPSPEDFNVALNQVYDDLDVVFSEFENIEEVALGNFNYITSRLNRLNHKAKQVSSLLSDYILYADYATKDAIFFGDTFTSTSRIEVNSSLLNSDQCEINQVEGIVTLPIDRAKQKKILIKELPVINASSNGTSGNSQEIDKVFNGDISVILDGNADTWFEYERVVPADDSVPLVLDLTILLSKPEVINFIRINPNNFGTRTQIEVLNVDTSVDGKEFISIKDDIPIADWVIEDEENLFTLAPSTSKYAGQGLYTFTPRKAKYIRLNLRQSTPYIIETTDGQMFRYAIGLRDIHIEAQPYKASGEIISSKYTSLDEIKKVVLLSNQNPLASINSSLASVDHYVSPDDGVTWYPIRPKESSGEANITQTVPELINFNTIDSGSVTTQLPVYTLRYKALLKRNSASFIEGNSDLAQVKEFTTELHKPPTTTPFSILASKSPIEGTMKVIDPGYGSRGKDGVAFTIATGMGAAGIYQLPFTIKKPFVKAYSSNWYLDTTGDEEVYINGIQWTKGNPLTAGSTDKVFSIDYDRKTIRFGDGTNGQAVETGSLISLRLGRERLYPASVEPHAAKLDYPTVRDQKEVDVYYVEPTKSETRTLQKGSKIHQLNTWVAASPTPIFSNTTIFDTIVSYINGSSELDATGKYSIDYEKGVVYSYDRTSTTTDTTVTYSYTPVTLLSEDDWSFDDGSGVASSININTSAWKTHTITTPETIPTGVKYFNLANLSIVQGSLSFAGSYSGVFDKEVPFVDGKIELAGVIKTTEAVPDLSGGAGNVTFTLNLKISTDTSFKVAFSNTSTFVTEVPGSPAAPGEYQINRSTRVVTVNISGATATDLGTVTYYYMNPNALLTGRYSVNYITGEIYTYTSTVSSTTVSYQYTFYTARYPIAREISDDNWELDKVSRKVILKDREILASQRTLQLTATGSRDKYYQIMYQYVKSTRENVSELEPYFSPMLKDYALKIITSSRLL